jgi:hypothetical protein
MLRIYTATHCPVNQLTQALIEQLHQTRPYLPLVVINLDDPAAIVPATIIGTPTYTWNGRVIFMGNPTIAELFSRIDQLQTV